jgi:DNA modification methylase
MNPYYEDDFLTIYNGDCRDVLLEMPEQSVHTVVTSPPYWALRDYGHEHQIGLEGTPDEYVRELVKVFQGVKRVLRDDGTVWLNLGDSYANPGNKDSSKVGGFTGQRIRAREAGDKPNDSAQDSRPRKIPPGLKPKDLVGIPWRVAFALQADGWYLRSDIIWHKPNPMPDSTTDRPTKAHEYLFLLAKNERYYYDYDAVREEATGRAPGNKTHKYKEMGGTKAGVLEIGATDYRNRRTVWTIASESYSGAHFATFPQKLVEPCILAGAPLGGVVLDPFGGSGTTGVVAQKLSRKAVLIDVNPEYIKQMMKRTRDIPMGLEF